MCLAPHLKCVSLPIKTLLWFSLICLLQQGYRHNRLNIKEMQLGIYLCITTFVCIWPYIYKVGQSRFTVVIWKKIIHTVYESYNSFVNHVSHTQNYKPTFACPVFYVNALREGVSMFFLSCLHIFKWFHVDIALALRKPDL